ncbi:MAG TPA: hypothetical protein VLR29_06800 [Flavobacterium sp.]|nr:hypothetical protein [Flavobacterium sp.]
MFLKYIKDYFLKRILKKNLQNVKSISSAASIQTVGLLIDESYFYEKEALVEELKSHGILESNIKLVVYNDKTKANESSSRPTFGIKHLNWKSEITNPEINDFINEEFDLLISYYDVEKAVLLNITTNSKALFKVGFSSVDKRLNHLIINTNAENHAVFVHELFRYLKLLNKI